MKNWILQTFSFLLFFSRQSQRLRVQESLRMLPHGAPIMNVQQHTQAVEDPSINVLSSPSDLEEPLTYRGVSEPSFGLVSRLLRVILDLCA
jgi:hypothetical protein